MRGKDITCTYHNRLRFHTSGHPSLRNSVHGCTSIKGAVACENHLSSKFVSEEPVTEGVDIFISLIVTIPLIYMTFLEHLQELRKHYNIR
jgi:hypothetical protein